MTYIKIGAKGLAKFIVAAPAEQRRVLRDYKFPDPEGHAQAGYYREARDGIARYHLASSSSDTLLRRAGEIRDLAARAEGARATRLRHNARALEQYAGNFGARKFEVLDDRLEYYECEGVAISVAPDLHVREAGKERLIKLEFAEDEPDSRMVRILCQLMLEVFRKSEGASLGSGGIQLFDVPRGQVHKGARVGSRTIAEIKAACQNISAIWPTL